MAGRWCTRRTKTSVSGLRTIIFFAPFLAALMQCNIILESASSWLELRLFTSSTLFLVPHLYTQLLSGHCCNVISVYSGQTFFLLSSIHEGILSCGTPDLQGQYGSLPLKHPPDNLCPNDLVWFGSLYCQVIKYHMYLLQNFVSSLFALLNTNSFFPFRVSNFPNS